MAEVAIEALAEMQPAKLSLGEVVVDYLKLIERAIGPNQRWVVAYTNDMFGCLPSARVLEEGGYETRGLYSGGVGYFAPSAHDVVVQRVRELARQEGRPKREPGK